MRKNRVRLTESQLQRVIKESVRRLVNENESNNDLFELAKNAEMALDQLIKEFERAGDENSEAYHNAIKAHRYAWMAALKIKAINDFSFNEDEF